MRARVTDVTRSADAPVVVGYPMMAVLFICAAALAFEVGPGQALLLGLLTGVAVWSNTTLLTQRGYLHMYALLLLTKLVLLVYQIQFRNLPLSGTDWGYYHKFGSQLAVENGGRLFRILSTSEGDLFTKLTAVAYSVFGAKPDQMYFFVFITSLVAFRYIYGAAELLLGDRLAAQRVAMIFMVWPNEVIMSVTFLREMPIQMLVAASFYHFVRFWRDRGPANISLAVGLSLAATLMHSGVIVIPVAYAYLAVRNKENMAPQLLRTGLFAVTVFLALQTPWAGQLLSKFSDASGPSELISELGSTDPSVATATTNYLNADLSAGSLLWLPYRFIMFSLSPLPWQAVNLGTVVAVMVEGIPRLLLVGMLALCYRRCRTGVPRQDVFFLGMLGAIAIGYAIFSIGVSNYGSAIRHRAKFFPIEIVLAYASYSAARAARVREANRDAMPHRAMSLLRHEASSGL